MCFFPAKKYCATCLDITMTRWQNTNLKCMNGTECGESVTKWSKRKSVVIIICWRQPWGGSSLRILCSHWASSQVSRQRSPALFLLPVPQALKPPLFFGVIIKRVLRRRQSQVGRPAHRSAPPVQTPTRWAGPQLPPARLQRPPVCLLYPLHIV